jgi:asparagine synthase (glutamine-hydrolysing)
VDEALYNQFQARSVRRVLSGYLGDLTVTNSSINPFPLLLLSGRFTALHKLIKQYNKNDNQPIGAFLKFILLTEFSPKRFQKFWQKYKNKTPDLRNIGQLPLTADHAELQKLQQKVNDTFTFPNLVTKNITHHVWPQNIYLFDEEEDCACSHHQLEVTYPLCDRRLIELVLQIPVEHFYAGGKKRGLIRKAMAGVLPEKVRNRKSKGSYSPEYPKLIKKEIHQILDGIRDENLDGLIDIQKLKIDLKNLSESEIEDSFTYVNWTLIEMVIWLFCSKTLENKEK